MISQSQLDYFKEVGIWYTGFPCFSPETHISCMSSFLSRDETYKANFLQTKFDTLFEGYSYMGQEDSANQYAADRLFTYVISEFFEATRHATEFQPLLNEQSQFMPQIRALEKELLGALSADLLEFYSQHVSHSLSANFYPTGEGEALRLTEHPDGSLLTVFPFGMDEEFQLQKPDGSWQVIERTDEIVCFSGYLMECLTDIKSLNHKVEKKGSQSDRFSFAYFSIPTPGHSFKMKGVPTTTEAYFEKYLSLFA